MSKINNLILIAIFCISLILCNSCKKRGFEKTEEVTKLIENGKTNEIPEDVSRYVKPQVKLAGEKLEELIGEPGEFKILYIERSYCSPCTINILKMNEVDNTYDDLRFEHYRVEDLEELEIKLEDLGLIEEEIDSVVIFDKNNKAVWKCFRPEFIDFIKCLKEAGYEKAIEIEEPEVDDLRYDLKPIINLTDERLEELIGKPGKIKILLYYYESCFNSSDSHLHPMFNKIKQSAISKYSDELQFIPIKAKDYLKKFKYEDIRLNRNSDCNLFIFNEENEGIWQIDCPNLEYLKKGLKSYAHFDKPIDYAVPIVGLTNEKLTELIGEPEKIKVLYFKQAYCSKCTQISQMMDEITNANSDEIRYDHYRVDELEELGVSLADFKLEENDLDTMLIFDKDNKGVWQCFQPEFEDITIGLKQAGLTKTVEKPDVPTIRYSSPPIIKIKGEKLEEIISQPGKIKIFVYYYETCLKQKNSHLHKLFKLSKETAAKYPEEIQFVPMRVKELKLMIDLEDFGFNRYSDCTLIIFDKENKGLWQISMPTDDNLIEGLKSCGFTNEIEKTD